MFSKKIVLEFICSEENLLEILEKPSPAKRITPEWFKKSFRYKDNIKDVDHNGDPNSTIKKCLPVTDMFMAGYHIPLSSDIWVENRGENNMTFRWATDQMEAVTLQSASQHTEYPTPWGYCKSVFKWTNPWIVKTPPGWSCLFLHPQHHEELPFRSLSALVDTDRFPAPVNIPFFIHKGYEGLISRGTPFVQIIPFKREEFYTKFSFDKGNVLKSLWDKAHSVFFDRYKKFFRQPKNFNEEVPKSKCPFGF